MQKKGKLFYLFSTFASIYCFFGVCIPKTTIGEHSMLTAFDNFAFQIINLL